MEPPAKRQRLGLGRPEAEDDDDDDELDFDPEELNQMRDPAYQLEQARDQAVYKLKSRFENIFAKYEKDFTGVGDEIDLRTGQVVVDNGHLQSMEFANDNDDGDDQDSEQEEERIMHGTRAPDSATSDAAMRRDPWAVRSRLSPMLGGSPRLSTMMSPSRNALITPPQSFDSFGSGATMTVDPAWQTPDLPRSAFLGGGFGLQGRQYGFGAGASTNKSVRKTLPAPHVSDGEDEDVLLGVSGNAPKQRQTMARSPLIKEKFPAVDSSPNNDSSLNELIQEVIESFPGTPQLVQKSVASRPGTEWQPTGSRNPLQSKLASTDKPRRKVGRPRKEESGGTKLAISQGVDGTSLPGSHTGPTERRKVGRPRKEESRGTQLAVSQGADDTSLFWSHTGPIERRKHSNSFGGRAGAAIQASGPGKKTSHFQTGDLDLYQDVTGLPAANSDRPFYVGTEARNVGEDGSHAGQAIHESTRTGVDADAAGSQRQRLTAVNGTKPGKQGPKPSNGQETFKPNVIDPVFAFSDEENLPPRRSKKDRRKSEPARLASPQVLQASRPSLQQNPATKDLSGRNVIDPSYAFSDEETNLPRRAKPTKGISDSAWSAKLSTETNSSAGWRPQDGPNPEPEEMPDVPLKRHGEQQAKRSSREPETGVGRTANGTEELTSSDALPTEGGEGRDTPLSADTDVPRSRSRIRRSTVSGPASSSVYNERAVVQEAEAAQPESHSTYPGTAKRGRGRPRKVAPAGSPELGEPSFTDAGPAEAEVEEDEDGPETESSATETSWPNQQPSTPKSRSKAAHRKTVSSRLSLISLLSDNEDEEDEISFDLSAFTPSGHHRILAHRPGATPHTASNSKGSNKKRASSLLHGPSSTSKIRKHRTPGSERKDGKGRRRDSTNSLARSVVRVRRESFREPSPAGSVVQTPGGTKRRCGKDGFRCERDFCFVCISI